VIPLNTTSGTQGSAASDGYVDVLALEDLPPGAQKSVPHGFQRVLLCRVADGIHAVADLCPHALQPLAGSEISDGVIRCARHGALFDLVTGKPRNGVTPNTLRVYPVRIREGRIQIGVAVPAGG
jgi:nitrite reductase/ring-hydroxylating ferredoxin subunit